MSRHDGKVWVRKLRTGYSTHPWEVRARNHGGYDYYETFYDWADAMEAADRLARTREVVLPRPNLNEDGKVEFDFTEWAGLDYTPDMPGGATYDRRTGPNKPAFGASVWIPREHWRPLAAALWALAEQENA